MTNNFTKEEYEIQHFGFTATEFTTDFKTNIEEQITKINLEAAKTTAKKLNLNDEQNKMLISEIKELSKVYSKKMEEILIRDKFYDITQSFFTIPENVLLPSDKIHDVNFEDEEDYDELCKEIDDLEYKYKQKKALLNFYNNELNFIDKLTPIRTTCDKIIDSIQMLPSVETICEQSQKINKKAKKINELLEAAENNVQLQRETDFLNTTVPLTELYWKWENPEKS